MTRHQIRVRDIEAKDVDTISKIHVDVWNETYRGILPDEEIDRRTYSSSKKHWAQALDKPDKHTFYLLAETEGQTAGFCIASSRPRDSFDYDSELMAINILKAHHRKGIGKALFFETMRRLQSMGCKKMYLWVAEKNINAIDFYRRLGCIPINESKEDHGSTEIAFGININDKADWDQ